MLWVICYKTLPEEVGDRAWPPPPLPPPQSLLSCEFFPASRSQIFPLLIVATVRPIAKLTASVPQKQEYVSNVFQFIKLTTFYSFSKNIMASHAHEIKTILLGHAYHNLHRLLLPARRHPPMPFIYVFGHSFADTKRLLCTSHHAGYTAMLNFLSPNTAGPLAAFCSRS